MKRQNVLFVVALIAICFISRIPQLISPNLLLDGDECIVALMGKHIYDGKDIAAYFYGQQYGFTLIESLVIAVFYGLFHVSDIAVKLAMLTLWTGGVLFFYKALANLNTGNKWLPVLMALVFILCPAWAVWSMKARGGYLTSFLLSTVVLSLLFNGSKINKNVTWIFIGALLVIIYQSQPLFLPGLIPLLGYALYKNFSWEKVLAAFVGLIPLAILFAIIKKHAGNGHEAEPFNFSLSAFNSIRTLPSFLFTHLHGYYYLSSDYKPSVYAVIFSIAMMCCILAIIAIALFWIIQRKDKKLLFYCAALSVVFTLAYTILLNDHNYRYLLPISGYTFFALSILINSIKIKHTVLNGSLIGFSVVGVFAMVAFYGYSFKDPTKVQLTETIKYAAAHDIHYGFSGNLLQWQLMFYSDERIICRWKKKTDRYQEYVERVNKAYSETPDNCALILFSSENTGDIKTGAIDLNNGYRILLHPDKKLLEQIGYDLLE